MSRISNIIKSHFTEETIKRDSVFIHLSKIKVPLNNGPPWLAGLDFNKHKFVEGKLSAKRLKVKLSQVTWLALMHSTYSQPVWPVLTFPSQPSFFLLTMYYQLTQTGLKKI